MKLLVVSCHSPDGTSSPSPSPHGIQRGLQQEVQLLSLQAWGIMKCVTHHNHTCCFVLYYYHYLDHNPRKADQQKPEPALVHQALLLIKVGSAGDRLVPESVGTYPRLEN